MSHIPAARMALVLEDRATRLARKEWTGAIRPETRAVLRAHVQRSQAGFAIVAIGMASAISAAAVFMAAAMGAI